MKVIELYIQEEDDESGVSALSLVKEAATHFDWLVFNSEECNGTCTLKKEIKTKGESFASYIDMGVQFRVEDLTEQEYHKFYSPFSTANQTSREDNDRELVRYYYAIDPARGAILKQDSRSICRDFVFAGLVYRDEDLTAMSRQLTTIDANRRLIPRTEGFDVELKEWKAGKQCNHIFRKLIFTVPEGMTKEQFASTLPTRAGQAFGIASRNEIQQGNGGISNRTGYLAGIAGFSSQDSPIGFVEGLIIYPTFQSMMKSESALGWTLLEINGVQGWINGAAEQDFFESEEVKVIKSGIIKEQFYNDYPEGAKEAAEMGIKRNEELGNPCATQVGKVRAQQIASGENLSLETLKRTYSYLSRAEDGFVEAQNKKEYDSCSYISYMLWGGLPMLRWVERKLNQIEMEMMGNTGCIGTLITDGVGELDAIYRCSKDPRAHLTTPYYDPAEGGEYSEHEEENNDEEMVDGIIELIVTIEDMEQRKLVTQQAIETLTEEGVSFDLMDFIRRVGLEGQMDFSRHTFKDEMKYEITTVVMEPDRYIVRRDPYTNEIYYVVFSKETIKLMSQKFFKQNRHKSFNVEHSDLKLNGGYVFESWLVQNPDTDKAAELGFRVNPGTWMVSLKWDNKEEFEKYVLSEETLGVSLEGSFLSRDFKKTNEKYSIIGEMDGEPIYSTEEEALERAEEIGCSGTHKHGDGWMACSSHPILQGVKTSLYKDEYDIFIEEVKDIINKK